MLRLSLLLLLFRGFLIYHEVSAEKGFLLTSSKTLSSRTEANLLLTLIDVKGEGQIIISLSGVKQPDLYQNNSIETFQTVEQSIEKGQDTSTIRFKVPELIHPENVYYEYYLQVNGSFPSDDYTFSNKSRIIVHNSAFVTFIQTDKPIYKPGQKVLFRILTVDKDLIPLKDTNGEIWIEDPTGTRMENWLDHTFSNSIEQFEFQLSSEPPLGSWNIYSTVNKKVSMLSFEVKEYVLPKFEVTITPPPFVLSSDKSITWKICTMYTYGMPVEGILKLNVSYSRYTYIPEGSYVPAIESVQEAKGCFNYTLEVGNLLAKKDPKVSYYYFDTTRIILAAEFEEKGTGATAKNSNTVRQIRRSRIDLKFADGQENTLKYLKPGFSHQSNLKVTLPDGTPAPNEPVEICYTSSNDRSNFCWEAHGSYSACKNFSSNDDGIIFFMLPPQTQDVTSVTFTATYMGPKEGDSETGEIPRSTANNMIRTWYSESGSYIQVSPIPGELKCGETKTISAVVSSTSDKELILYYQVLSRGRIVHRGQTQVSPSLDYNVEYDESYIYVPSDSDSNDSNEFFQKMTEAFEVKDIAKYKAVANLDITPDFEMSPSISLLAFYIRDDGEIIADSSKYTISKCLRNNVTFEFNPIQAYPGSQVNYKIQASPNSLCGIATVDKSISLMSQANKLTLDRVYDYLETQSMQSYLEQKSTRFCPENPKCPPRFIYPKLNRQKRSVMPPSTLPSRKLFGYVDSIFAFDDAGTLALSDFTIETRPCDTYLYPVYPQTRIGYDMPVYASFSRQGGGAAMPAKAYSTSAGATLKSNSKPKAVVDLRQYFPETWLWELEMVGEDGILEQQKELPHTITKWIGNSVCLDKVTGLGISEETSITAFQPFFVSFNLPYSVIRGERVPLVISVSNYLEQCLPIKLTIDVTDEFSLKDPTASRSFCICGGEVLTKTFVIIPKTLGKINMTVHGNTAPDDSICEGNDVYIQQARDAESKPLLVLPEGFPQETAITNFVCPQDEENGTFKTDYNLSLPDDLVEGSERIFVFVSGDLLGPAIKNINRLVNMPTGCGEQNLVKFIPNVMVLKYLQSTGKEDKDLKNQAINNLKLGYQRQLTFKRSDNSYSTFSSDFSGSIWLTSFVVKSFSLAKEFVFIDQEDITRSTDWIVSQQLPDGCFRLVGFVHSYSLRGGYDQSRPVLSPLTSYIIISLLEAGFENQTIIDRAMDCLSVNTNPDLYTLALFSYASTLANNSAADRYFKLLQDKALHKDGLTYWSPEAESDASRSTSIEIAGYAVLTYLHTGGTDNLAKALPIIRWISKQMNGQGGFVSTQDTVIALQALAKYASFISKDEKNLKITATSENIEKIFTVDSTNQLVFQSQKFDLLPSEVEGTGTGCGVVQALVRYNVKTAPKTDSFNITIDAKRLPKCNVAEIHTCFRYKLDGISNMVVAEIKLVSGFIPLKESLNLLLENRALGLQKYETEEQQINLYFNGMTKESNKCLRFFAEEEIAIENAQPANVKIYDYYKQERTDSTDYSMPSSESCR